MGYDMISVRNVRDKKAYFRANIWGMGSLRTEMLRRGMLMTDYELPSMTSISEAELLRWSPTPVSGIPIHKLGSNDGWIVTPQDIRAALTIHELSHSLVGAEVGVIDSESEILMAPDQAFAAALVGEDVKLEPADQEFWDEWIAWLELAAKHGGFYVY